MGRGAAGGAVGLGAPEELLLGQGRVLRVLGPAGQRGGLQGAAEAEGERPGQGGTAPVDRLQVGGGLALRLAAGQEADAGHGRGHAAGQGLDGGDGHLPALVLGLAALARAHHAGGQQGALHQHVVVGQGLVQEGQRLLRGPLRRAQVVVAVRQYLQLHDGHEAVLLADGGEAGEDVGVGLHGQVGRGVLGDPQRAAPLGEEGARALVGLEALGQVVQALRRQLLQGARQRHPARVRLDAGHDPRLAQDLHEGLAVAVRLVEGLVEHDHPGDAVRQLLVGREERLAVLPPVLLRVRHPDALEQLVHRFHGLVGRQDTLARLDEGPRDGAQLHPLLRRQVLDKLVGEAQRLLHRRPKSRGRNEREG